MKTEQTEQKISSQDVTEKQSKKLKVQFFSIGRKLTVGFGILVILTFVTVGMSYFVSSGVTQKINTTDKVRVPMALAASRAQANLLRIVAEVHAYLALGEQKYRENYRFFLQAFEINLAELNTASLEEQDQRRLNDLKNAYTEWKKLPDQLFDLRDDQLDREPAYKLLATDGVQLAGNVLINISTLIDTQSKREPTAENLDRLKDMAEFQGNFAAMLSALRGYVTTQNRIYRGEFEINLADNQNIWESLSGKRDTFTANQQKLLDEMRQNRDAFLQLPEKLFDILKSDQWRLDLYKFSTEALPLSEKMQKLLSEMTDDQQGLLTQELGEGTEELLVTNQYMLAGGFIALCFGIALSFIFRSNIGGPVRRLTHVADHIRSGDLDEQALVESHDEIGILAETFNNMTGQLRQTLTQVRKEKKRADDLLDVVIPIGVDLSSEKDFNRLLEKMLLEAKAFCHADAGTLYLLSQEKKQLEFVIVRNDAKKLALGGTTGSAIPFSPLSIPIQPTEFSSHCYVATQVAVSGTSSNIAHYNRQSEIINDYQVDSVLTIPLKNGVGQVLGILQLLNAQDRETHEIIPFDQNLQQMMESFSSLAVAALEAYVREQSLKKEINQLRIEIDEVKRQKQVSEIVETTSFKDLQTKAAELRRRRQSSPKSTPPANEVAGE